MGSSQQKISNKPIENKSETDEQSQWREHLEHARINHETRFWEFSSCQIDLDAERWEALLTSWTTNWLRVVDHAYKWGGLEYSDSSPAPEDSA